MRIAVSILAGYRILRLIQLDSITLKFRQRTWAYLSKRKRLRPLRELIDCPWCLSVWIAGFVIMANAWFGKPWEVLSAILALSALIGFAGWLDHEHIG